MSKTDYVGRITRLLISTCVVPAGLGLSILHAQGAEMPGLSRNQSPCGDSTGRSTGVSARRAGCDCPHCRDANSSDSPLLRFFKSHRTKWSERPPKNSWEYYHPCPPYFQPTFGIHQTSWTILPHDPCQNSFATPHVYAAAPLPSAMELQPSTPPVPPVSPPVSLPDAAPVAQPVAPPEAAPDAPPKVAPEAQPEARNEKLPSRVTPAAAEISAGDSRSRI